MDIKSLLNSRSSRTLEITNPQETDAGLVIELAASSDVPYRRQFGYETLLHTKEAVDYERVAAGAVPLLYNHKNDEYIGIVEKVWLVPGQLRAVVRLSKNSDLARQISADIKDGILKSISIGYEINEMREAEAIGDIPQYIATRWTLYEISIVTTPADYIKAGIGRMDEQLQTEEPDMKKRDFGAVMEMVNTLSEEEKLSLLQSLADDLEDVADAGTDAGETEVEVSIPAEEMKEDMMNGEMPKEEMDKEGDYTQPSMETSEGEATDEEEKVIMKSAPKANSRSNTGDTMSNQPGSTNGADNTVRLAELAAKYERTADLATWIKEGKTAEAVALEILETKSNSDKVSAPAIHVKKNETPEFASAVTSWLRGDNSELAERGIDQARASGQTITNGTLYIPTNVPMIKSRVVRDGTAYGNTGANLTGKVFLTFEETLREGALLSRVGGQIVSLNDVATMPYYTSPSVAAMYAETGSITEGEVTVGLKTWAPKRIGARYVFSNLLNKLNGTYSFEQELYSDLLAESVRIFDSQSWSGTGANNMTGISQDSNITALNLSGSMALASASAMLTQIAKNNASVENSVFVVDHDVYSQMFATQAFGAGSGMSILDIVTQGNRVFRTGYLSKVGGKAVALVGDFAKVTGATFGAVEIKRDDLTKLQTGQTVLDLQMYADTVVRQPAAIAKWANITV